MTTANTFMRTDPSRFLHIAIIFLQVFSVAQVVWWFVDQRNYAGANADHIRTVYNYDVAAAQRLLSLNVAPAEITSLFPQVEVRGEAAQLKDEAVAAIDDDRQRHVNQYAWESAFFLIVQALAIAVLWRGLTGEREIRAKQDSFLAMVSHQFKTPIASLQLSLETMVKRQLSPERFQQLTQRMLDDLARMQSMVSKILDSARLDRGRVQLNKEQLSLADSVRHVVATLDDHAKREKVTFHIDIPASLDIRADRLAVDGVLRNLIENAMSAMKPMAGGTITITGRMNHGVAELAIADTGIGFEPGQGPKLFEKFFRIDDHGGRNAAGTGLGLFIVRRFMHFENGDVQAHSEGAGRGATFTVTWPAAQAS